VSAVCVSSRSFSELGNAVLAIHVAALTGGALRAQTPPDAMPKG